MPGDEDLAPLLAPVPPDSPMNRFFTMSRGDLRLEETREAFEGKEEYEAVCHRLRQKMSGRAAPKEANRFLQLMKERGGGNIALAWRRWFDSDGDGTLSFREFCSALIVLKYKGDVPALWSELGGNVNGVLSLEALDPDNAAILDYFGSWCCQPCFGGPLQVFKMIDTDGSDSLTPEEFTSGLRRWGFFNSPGLLSSLRDEEAVLVNLFPLLDQSGTGCIAPGQIVFLEKDGDKKEQLERQIARIAKHGAQAAPEPLHNDAQRMLHTMGRSTTMLGGKQWKMHATEHACGNLMKNNRGLYSSHSASSLRSSPSSSKGRKSPSARSTTTLPHIGSEPQLHAALSQDPGRGCLTPPKHVDRVALRG